MWTPEQCLAKAAELERQAGPDESEEARLGLLELAKGWRQAASQAERSLERRFVFID